MVWVALEVARRLRRSLGAYRGDEWEACAEELGIRCRRVDLPIDQPAMLIDRTLFLHSRLPAPEAAWWAWHELAHHVMHPGNVQFWDALAWGHLVVSKQERQAWEFAVLFPLWGES